MRSTTIFLLFCLIASLKMPDRAISGRHRSTDTIPLTFGFEPIRPHVHVWRDTRSYTFHDSLGNSISIKDSTEVVIKGDTAKAVLGLFKWFEVINNRSDDCECKLSIKYFRKGKLVKTAGGANGYILHGQDFANVPIKVDGRKIYADSISFHAKPK